MASRDVRLVKMNERPFRLVTTRRGGNGVGGSCAFTGVIPKNSKVPVQQLLLIDLRDPNVPLECEGAIDYLPILYPFKYGGGGAEIQYSVAPDSKVRLIYLSDPEPDAPDWQYLQVDELPEQPLKLQPLTYDEARCLTFLRYDGHFQPNRTDLAILEKLDVNNLISFGGRRSHIPNAPDIHCRNPKCERRDQRTYFEFITSVPPIPVKGIDDFWYEFQGAYVNFCFGLCHYCGTVIGFNVA